MFLVFYLFIGILRKYVEHNYNRRTKLHMIRKVCTFYIKMIKNMKWVDILE